MYDDGYPWPPGDNYSLKQACDDNGYLNIVRSSLINDEYQIHKSKNLYKYYDNFANVSLDITLSHKKCIYQDMINRIDTYYEFPPLWSGSYRGLNGPLLKTIRQYPLMNKIEAKAYLKKFKFKNLKLNSEISKYTFFTYAKIKESLYQPIDCLSELYDQHKFPPEYRLISNQRTLNN